MLKVPENPGNFKSEGDAETEDSGPDTLAMPVTTETSASSGNHSAAPQVSLSQGDEQIRQLERSGTLDNVVGPSSRLTQELQQELEDSQRESALVSVSPQEASAAQSMGLLLLSQEVPEPPNESKDSSSSSPRSRQEASDSPKDAAIALTQLSALMNAAQALEKEEEEVTTTTETEVPPRPSPLAPKEKEDARAKKAPPPKQPSPPSARPGLRAPNERRPSNKAAAGGLPPRRPVLPTRKASSQKKKPAPKKAAPSASTKPLAVASVPKKTAPKKKSLPKKIQYKHAPSMTSRSSTKRATYKVTTDPVLAQKVAVLAQQISAPPTSTDDVLPPDSKKRKYDIHAEDGVAARVTTTETTTVMPATATTTTISTDNGNKAMTNDQPSFIKNGPLTPFKRKKLKEEKETNQAHALAQQAAILAHQIISSPHIAKQLLLTMALVRINPRAAPETWPPPGSVIEEGFFWGTYPPLETVLRAHMRTYYDLSTKMCQSKDQQQFNNDLTVKTRLEAAKYGWYFGESFTDKVLRDRIRCYFKTHIQNSKKRLRTMVKNPTKKANAKALCAHLELIHQYAELESEGDEENFLGEEFAKLKVLGYKHMTTDAEANRGLPAPRKNEVKQQANAAPVLPPVGVGQQQVFGWEQSVTNNSKQQVQVGAECDELEAAMAMSGMTTKEAVPRISAV